MDRFARIGTLFRSLSRRAAHLLAVPLLVGTLAAWSLSGAARAQAPEPHIIRDGTVGMENEPLEFTDLDVTITEPMGAVRGEVLLQSFSRLNVPTGGSLTFTADTAGLAFLLSRVTSSEQSFFDGGVVSEIPNVYVLNPNGVITGPNAWIDVPGTFTLSTANSLRFENGATFYTDSGLDGAPDSILHMPPPEAFGLVGAPTTFGFTTDAPGGLTIDGSQLAVETGQTLALIGGGVAITGEEPAAQLRAPSGRILVASVASSGEIVIMDEPGMPDLDVSSFEQLGDVVVSGPTLDVGSPDGNGSVVLRSLGLLFEDGQILARTTDADGAPIGIDIQVATATLSNATLDAGSGILFGSGSAIRIAASEELTLEDTSLSSDGPGGDITLRTPQLKMVDSVLESSISSFGFESGGTITLDVEGTAELIGRAEDGMVDVIITEVQKTASEATGPNVEIDAGTLILRNARILGDNQSAQANLRPPIPADEAADGGNIRVTADRVEMENAEMSAETTGLGDAGNVELNVRALSMDGSAISTSSSSLTILGPKPGRAGSIDIRGTSGEGTPAESVSLRDSRLSSTTEGGAGSIRIFTEELSLGDGSGISTTTTQVGDDGGSIDLEVRGQLRLERGSRIESNSFFGWGDGGPISIEANSIILDGPDTAITADTSFSSAFPELAVLLDILHTFDSDLVVRLISPSGTSVLLFSGVGGSGNDFQGTRLHDGGISLFLSGSAPFHARFAPMEPLAQLIGEPTAGTWKLEITDRFTFDQGELQSWALEVGEEVVRSADVPVPIVDDTTVTSTLFVDAEPDAVVEAVKPGGGDIELTAHSIAIRNGASVSSSTSGTGDAGSITVDVSGTLSLASGGSISTGSSGRGAGGTVAVRAGHVDLAGAGSSITADTSLSLSVTDLAVILDILHSFDSDLVARLISPSGTPVELFSGVGGGGDDFAGTRLDDRALISIFAGSAPFAGSFVPSEALSQLVGEPAGGTWTLEVTDNFPFDQGEIRSWALDLGGTEVPSTDVPVAIVDNATVSSSLFVDPADLVDDGGDIFLDANTIEVRNGASISASSTGSGDAGSIRIGERSPGSTVLLSDGTISTSALAADGGDVVILAREGIFLERGSTIEASVAAGGSGGNVTIGSPQTRPDIVVLRQASAIRADAGEGGTGGRIAITTDAFFKSPDGVLDASAPGGPEAQGEIVIDAPTTNIVSGVKPLNTEFLDASALLRPSCAARAARGHEGSFHVARRRGLPASPEELLLAFDDLGADADALAGMPEAPPPVAAGPPPQAGIQVAQNELTRGATAFRGGHYEAAAERQSRAAALYVEAGDGGGRGDALRALAQSQQALGHYGDSVQTLREALDLAEGSAQEARIAAALGSLGNAYLGLRDTGRAEEYLTRALAAARKAGRPGLAAGILNNLGNQQAVLGNFAGAQRSYEESAALAREAGRPLQEARALSNGARAALDGAETRRAVELLGQTKERVRSLPATHGKAYVLIHLAKSYERLAALDPGRREASLLDAHAALTAAIELAQTLDEPRALSYALGNLGALYWSERRTEEALVLTRRARREAERGGATESLYRWHWQEGKLLWAQGRPNAAIGSYRRAVDILEETRQEALARYGSSEVHFRRAVAPVYLELVDALLQGSEMLDDPARSRTLLAEARDTMEHLKAAELRDHFRDECVADLEAKEIELDPKALARLSPDAAVVYPILLPDRLELLVSLPEGLERYRVDVPAAELAREVGSFRERLQIRTTPEYLPHARQLYAWLVEPFAEALEAQDVKTLVFVPDGPLRTIPMAALHDGKEFLAQRYALAVTPGLSLVDPKSLDLETATLLLAGVSEAVQDFSPLASVPAELEAIHALYGGEVLLDEAFEARRFEKAVAAEEPSVVHLASHAVFTGHPETSFLLTHDGRLTMERLSDIVAPTQFRAQPLELLVLSACETAAGDERAALGLAGVAIGAGARSALASLWRIDDPATYALITAFYEELGDPAVSKAVALQRAQGKLLEGVRFSHPFFWSPFLLISNWL